MTFAEFESKLRARGARVYNMGPRPSHRTDWYVNVYIPPKVPHPKVGTYFPEWMGHAFGPSLSIAMERALTCTVTHWSDKTRTIDLATGVESTRPVASNKRLRTEDLV